MNAKNANSGAVPYTLIYVCVRECVCVSEQWNEILSRLAADQQKAKQRRKNGWKRPTRAAADSAAARKAEFVVAAKRAPRRAVPHCIEELSARDCIKNKNILLFVSGIQNNAYENTYIYIHFCVCVRGRQSVVLPVCVCAAHFYLFISFVQKAQTRWFILNTRSAVGGNCDWFCNRILLHTHTRTAHTHVYTVTISPIC